MFIKFLKVLMSLERCFSGIHQSIFSKGLEIFWRENDVPILMWSEEYWKPLSSGGDGGYFIGLFQPDEFREIGVPSNFEELEKKVEEVWNGLVRYDLLDREWRYLWAFDTLVEKENIHNIPIELVVREVSDERVSKLDRIMREFAESNRKSWIRKADEELYRIVERIKNGEAELNVVNRIKEV